MPKSIFLFRTVHLVIFVHGTSSHWNWLYDAGLGLGLGQPVFTHPASMPKASHTPRTSCSTVYILILLNYQIFVPLIITQSHQPFQYKQRPYKSHKNWILANNSFPRHWPPWLSTQSVCLQTTLVNKVDVSVSLFKNKKNLQFFWFKIMRVSRFSLIYPSQRHNLPPTCSQNFQNSGYIT